ncbi:hypothetical protein O6H91_10G080600 [Diphasiastrum complanatum]|uniref:Uncharacterized protein n=1 Tax=Diphasiastrum complanatum TaxID=34168 RepID=A0ACC2CIQ0_DIPCM|nr:hypothetical protein O6H91_10G080600 [Diphasiastrum complanatum]
MTGSEMVNLKQIQGVLLLLLAAAAALLIDAAAAAEDVNDASASGSMRRVADAAKQATVDSFQTTADSAKQTGEGIRHAGASAYDSLSEAARAVGETVKGKEQTSHGTAAQGTLKETLNSVSDRLKQPFEDFSQNTIWKAAEKLRQQARDLAASLQTSLSRGLSFSPQEDSKAGAGQQQIIQQYYNSVSEMVMANSQKMLEYVEAAREAAREAADKAGEGLNIASKEKETQTTMEKIKSMAERATQEASQLGSGVKNTVWQEAKRGSNSVGMSTKSSMNKQSDVKSKAKHYLMVFLLLLHHIIFSTIFGSFVWVTFISAAILSRNTPRQQFGFLQSKIFPVFFKLVAAGQALLLLTHAALHPWRSADQSQRWQYLTLLFALALTLLNVFLLEPMATKLMFDRLKQEKEEGRGQDAGPVSTLDEKSSSQLIVINRKLNRLQGYSAAANMASFTGMAWHLWYLL